MLTFLSETLCAQPVQQTVRFTVFSAKPIASLVFAPRPGAAPQKLVFYPTARSPRCEFRGTMPIKFTDATTGAVVAEATVPPSIRDALLLFSPIADTPADSTRSTSSGQAGSRQTTGLRYQVAVLDDGALAHGPGGLAILNLSGLALSGTVGAKAVTLQPGLSAPLAIGRSAKVVFRTTTRGRTFQSYADTVQLTARQRALLILFPPFYQGSLEVQSRLLLDEPPVAPGGR